MSGRVCSGIATFGDESAALIDVEEIIRGATYTGRLERSPIGYGVLRRVLLVIKQIEYMEQCLPEIACNRADPWLKFTIKDPQTNLPYEKATHDKVKERITGRKPGENLIDDGSITVEEVYQAAGVGGCQTIEGILNGFYEQLHAGLGVPEIALASGSTTLKGTASFQDAALEAEAYGIQHELKRFHEQVLFKALGVPESVSLN